MTTCCKCKRETVNYIYHYLSENRRIATCCDCVLEDKLQLHIQLTVFERRAQEAEKELNTLQAISKKLRVPELLAERDSTLAKLAAIEAERNSALAALEDEKRKHDYTRRCWEDTKAGRDREIMDRNREIHALKEKLAKNDIKIEPTRENDSDIFLMSKRFEGYCARCGKSQEKHYVEGENLYCFPADKPACSSRWIAGVVQGPETVPDGARCLLKQHGNDVPCKFMRNDGVIHTVQPNENMEIVEVTQTRGR